MEDKILSIAILNLENDMNIGGIVRTANAAGVHEIMIIGRKKWNKATATGTHRRARIKKMRTADEFIEFCKINDYKIVSLEITENSKNVFDFVYPKKTMLVIGNEGIGINEKIISNSDSIIRIPQYGDVECLNASVSAGIAIYDWVRKNQISYEKNISGQKYTG